MRCGFLEQKNAIVYEAAAETIKTAILQGQYEALKGENRVQLVVYFGIGKYISLNSRNGDWGTGALAAISERLRKILPGLRGFSATQLKEMRLFYEGWIVLDNKSSVDRRFKKSKFVGCDRRNAIRFKIN